MSFAIFKDFDKSTSDIFSEEFDTKHSLKVKAEAPAGVTITTTTSCDCKDACKMVPKLGFKWPHSSGFTLEKLEFAGCGGVTTETSLTGLAPNLKLEFKGNQSKADLSFNYAIPSLLTMTGEVDALALSRAAVSVHGGSGAFTAGAAADFGIEKSAVSKTCFEAGFGYTANNIFAGLRAKNNFSDFHGQVAYSAIPKFTLAAQVGYCKSTVSSVLAAIYKCNPDTVCKFKVSSAGDFNASVKQSFQKKFSIVGSVCVPRNISDVKFGINATLG